MKENLASQTIKLVKSEQAEFSPSAGRSVEFVVAPWSATPLGRSLALSVPRRWHGVGERGGLAFAQ